MRKLLIFLRRAKMFEHCSQWMEMKNILSGSLSAGNVIAVTNKCAWTALIALLQTARGSSPDYEDVKWVIWYLLRISWVRVNISIFAEGRRNAAVTVSYIQFKMPVTWFEPNKYFSLILLTLFQTFWSFREFLNF